MSGLVMEAVFYVSKFNLLSVKIIVEPGSFAMLPVGQLILSGRHLYQMKVGWFADSKLNR
jgi:hypothetical protein